MRFTLDKNFPLHYFHTQKTPTQQIVFRNHQANGEVDSMQVPLFQLQVLHCTAAQKAAVFQLPESECGWEVGGILKWINCFALLPVYKKDLVQFWYSMYNLHFLETTTSSCVLAWSCCSIFDKSVSIQGDKDKGCITGRFKQGHQDYYHHHLLYK